MKPGDAMTLHVYREKDLVGYIGSTDESPLIFQYTESWLKAGKQAISLSLPLREASYQKEAQFFFANLFARR